MNDYPSDLRLQSRYECGKNFIKSTYHCPVMSSTVTKVLRRLEVQHDGVFYADRPPTAWGNRDIWPVPLEQRRFTAISYLSFWVIAVGSPSAWAFGGSAIALGLSPGYAIGSVVTGSALLTIVAYLCGFVGSHLHLGYAPWSTVDRCHCCTIRCLI